MPRTHLTEVAVRALKPSTARQVTYFDKVLPAFGCRVTPAGTKSWVVMHGSDRKLTTLGRFPDLSLSEARSSAKKVIAGLPEKAAPSLSFQEALDLFLAHCDHKNRPRTTKDYRRLLTRHFVPRLGSIPLNEITAHHVTAAVDRLLKTPSECSHAFVALKILFRWAVRRRLIQNSPCEGLYAPTKAIPRERVLTDDELRTVFLQAERTGFPFGCVLQLLIHTGQRRSEIGSLEWSWVDLSARTIAFPSSVTKNKRPHVFPISGTTAKLLEAMPRTSKFVFPGSRDADLPISGWSNFKTSFDKACSIQPWTLHDLRRTFATAMAALGVRIEVTEKLLNHVSGSFGGIVSVYQKHSFMPEMREAIERWEKRLAEIVV